MCQFFLISAIFSKKVLQFYVGTFFPRGYLTWNCVFSHRQFIHVSFYKKSVLKTFFHLALAVIFCLRQFCHQNLSRPKSLYIGGYVRVFIEGFLSLRVSSIYMCLKICQKLLIFHHVTILWGPMHRWLEASPKNVPSEITIKLAIFLKLCSVESSKWLNIII